MVKLILKNINISYDFSIGNVCQSMNDSFFSNILNYIPKIVQLIE